MPVPDRVPHVGRRPSAASTAAEAIVPAERGQRPIKSREAAVLPPHAVPGVDVSLAGARRPDALDGVLSRAVRAARLDRVLDERELRARGRAILDNRVPTTGANLWLFTNPRTGTRLYIVGTIHGDYVIRRMEQGVELLEFLLTAGFDAVYAELEESLARYARFDVRTKVVDVLREARAKRIQFASKPKKLSDFATDQILSFVPTMKLDDLLVAAATDWKGCAGLETDTDRSEVRREYETAAGKNTIEQKLESYDEMEGYVAAGNEVALNLPHVHKLLKGKDLQDIESRNQRWVRSMPADYHPGKKVLWVVGASHLAGLRVELSERGWLAQSVDLKPASSSSSVATRGVAAVGALTGADEVD